MQSITTPDTEVLIRLYRSVLAAREIDILEAGFVQRGEAFFHVSGGGHENMVCLQPHLIEADFLHCHYRDKALMLGRGVPPRQFFLSLFCKDQSHSRGRQMSAHLSDPTRNIMSIVGPVGNNALQAAGVASVIKRKPGNPIVYCGIGDGTSQQGEVLEAIAQAVRDELPVLFVIQDNQFAISTKTRGRTFYSRPDGAAAEFYGVPIRHIRGSDPLASYREFGELVERMRRDRRPAIAVFEVIRLDSHTNADDHRVYRSDEEIAAGWKVGDPVAILEERLKEQGLADAELAGLRKEVRAEIAQAAEEAQSSADPIAIMDAKAEIPEHLTDPVGEYHGAEPLAENGKGQDDQLTMLEALREVLKFRLKKDPRVTLFGEDLEDPKGDVFGITRGLTELFPGRVVNSPLAESTIVGYSLGQALAGSRPVCFLQFADFLPIAFNQIWAELASLYWRTDGGWKAPLIIMAPTGGFKPGLGPFHASSMESLAAHTPGLDVFLPSSAGDAAGLLNACFESERPTVFFYPKSLLNDRSRRTSKDVSRQLVPIGRARLRRSGSDLTLIGWGNAIPMLERTATALTQAGVSCDLLDLRSISPWDHEAVLESARKTRKVIVVQEENQTASMASEISATIAESAGVPVTIRRVTRADTFVPCNFANQLEVLPSYRRILAVAVELLGGSLTWDQPAASADCFVVEAMGVSPADESVTVLNWLVQVGDQVIKGLPLAEVEADKAAFDIASPVEGRVEEILVPVGRLVRVGTPLLRIKTAGGEVTRKLITREEPGTPRITLPVLRSVAGGVDKIDSRAAARPEFVPGKQAGVVAGIVALASQVGGRVVTNEEIAQLCPTWKAEDIFTRVGIKSRYWIQPGETALTLATSAARKLLQQQGLGAADLNLILVTTGTPVEITPSMACLVLSELSMGADQRPVITAVDLSAACSGYLYGLQYAHDFLLAQPEARILLITTEVLSQALDTTDPGTAPIFGDAATATLLVGAGRRNEMRVQVERPVLGARGENGSILKLPRDPNARIHMDGLKVFPEAVRSMLLFLERACEQAGITAADLDLVIAHQANQRILNAVRQKAHLPEERVYSAIADFGNTSSSSIPLCLERLLPGISTGKTWALCAFGGGFTFGGAILRTLDPDSGK